MKKSKVRIIIAHKKSKSNLDFRCMSFFFRIRDMFKSPIEKIEKAGIKPGDIILDYGCGSGSYTIAAAETVGPSGKIFAADIHPLAIEQVKKKALKKGFKNIHTIQTNCKTDLESNCIDIIICFDVFHDIDDKVCILNEFYRLLKPGSILSFDDHHLKENEILETLTSDGLFKLQERKENQYNFVKVT